MVNFRSFIGAHNENWEDAQLWVHPELEITIIMEGRGRFRANDEEVAIESGHVVLIPPNFPHSFHASSPIRFGVIPYILWNFLRNPSIENPDISANL